MNRHRILLQRVYGTENLEGYRVLIDRLWPRGIKKENLNLDLWVKDLAPAADLRKWYGHDISRFEEFSRRYQDWLNQSPKAVKFAGSIAEVLKEQDAVLLYAAKLAEYSNAVVFRNWLEKEIEILQQKAGS